MTYADHLDALIRAFLQASPGWSQRRLSREAGLGENWVGLFLRTKSANVVPMQAVVRLVADHCPTGPQGDPVRRLLAVFDEAPADLGRDAA